MLGRETQTKNIEPLAAGKEDSIVRLACLIGHGELRQLFSADFQGERESQNRKVDQEHHFLLHSISH